MDWHQSYLRICSMAGRRSVLGLMALGLSTTALRPAPRSTDRPAAGAPVLVFDHVTVIDVEHGTRLSDQRVVIAGNRIRALGTGTTVKIPAGAHVVDARGKYLIPGLWDMHVHPAREIAIAYPLFIAYGVTGIRDAGSPVPLDTLRLLRREILAGTRVGPPRQLLSGQSIMGPVPNCNRGDPERRTDNQTCVTDSADAVHYVDSLKAAGADMIKPRAITTREVYAAIAAEARRLHMPFGGHIGAVTELEASDYGVTIIDHEWGDAGCAFSVQESPAAFGGIGLSLSQDNGLKPGDPKLTSCWQRAAERFRKNGTWFVPTLIEGHKPYVLANYHFGLLLLAGTDYPDLGHGWGTALHEELTFYVEQGLTPLEALQTATLNPAKMLHATDSLGTVAPGTLADLVLLDADPLADITNTQKIHAVVANGRYFDRAALDTLLADARAAAKAKGRAAP